MHPSGGSDQHRAAECFKAKAGVGAEMRSPQLPLNVSATSRPVDLLDIADVLREEAEWQAHCALAAAHKVVRVAECTRVLLSGVTSMSSRDVQDADREDTLMHSLTVSDTNLWRGLAPPCWSTGQRPSNYVLRHETEDERTSIQIPRSTTRKKT